MGRKKVEIKRIEDKNSRQATFSKRRNGLMKKAKQLCILCDVDVAALVFSSRGRLFEFSSTNSLTGIIHRYHNHMKAEDKVSADVNDTEESKYASFMPMEELLQTVEKKFEEPDVNDLSITDLVHLENQVETALTQTRFRKVGFSTFLCTFTHVQTCSSCSSETTCLFMALSLHKWYLKLN
ncbi:hypothetical protein RND71_023255 [Anisodus tanguticus]|uniref:MADS-box domain-containing protein n=1 Tax=Anisodus tanguticus TaxID=243964 RepID=A0AAE1RU25_9SOLA|nr:hypothetical protein RND71_023255 [Anisodus tanguticus]